MAFSIDSQSLLSVGASMYCCKAGHVLAGQLKGIAPHIRDVSSITQGPQVPRCCSLLSTRNTFFSKFSSYQEVIYLYNKVISTLWQASEWPIMITSSDKFDSTSNRLLSFSVIIGVTDIFCCIKWYYLLSPCFLFVVNTCLSTQHKCLQNIWPAKFVGIYPTAVLSRGMESTTHIGPEKTKKTRANMLLLRLFRIDSGKERTASLLQCPKPS